MAEVLKKDPKQSEIDPGKKFKENFQFLKVIGEGSFSTVHLAKDKETGKLFAIKECVKSQIIREKKVKYIHLEKKILSEILKDSPYFVTLCFTFQDEESLYFGLTYCSNGDLLSLIKKSTKFSLPMAEFYAAEIVSGLEYMHDKKVIHRDLKPENILLTEELHIKITDFGTARILDDETNKQLEAVAAAANPDNDKIRRRRNSFVGTAQFVSPECLQGKSPHIASDLWALACVVFQMITGNHLFTGNHEYDIFKKVTSQTYTITEDFPSNDAKDLIEKLIKNEPEDRLGASSYTDLKSHQFFSSINWDLNLSEQTPPKKE